MEDSKKELKRLNLNEPTFTANGRTYYIEQGLSIERYVEFQILEKELAFGMTFQQLINKNKELYKVLNRGELVNASVLVNNIVQGLAKVVEREPTALKMCALFINEEAEDRTVWNQDLIVRKIEDWKREGIDVRDFFALALNSVNGFLNIYNKMCQIISANPGKPVSEVMTEALKD